ncbi:MBG domain-containing protein [Croceicoccus sp. YJ47]|uniref:MBG domain-containing protein n=1 Tax=Croceicoccus sp. YJ47 TaxID=2798724 RepID=UPI001923EBDD|nr:MBG domain-containing protein [Croceicoccus sp. YJ47]QQN74293.1 hypothetical protein JD971_00290 [Croceicoccus sp. YJ47]
MAQAQNLARNIVNLPGEATSVGGSDGNIVLMGQVEARGGTVTVAGGGTITLNAVSIDVSGMEARGAQDGGAVRIGGDWNGEGPMLRAENLSVDGRSVIRADAAGTGHGGSVVLWSDGRTDFAGTISARGGGVGGDGGMAEVSGRRLLAYTGAADLRAVAGRTGDLLLDPYNITISNGPNTGPGNDSIINATTLENQLETASVTISTRGGGTQAGDITVAVPLAWDANTLTLLAAGSVNVDAVMTAGGTAKLAVLTENGALNVRGGRVDFTSTDNGLSINGDAYTIITALGEAGSATGTDLQGIDGRPGGFYALGADLDASATAGWNGGAGFAPIGGGAAEFTGKFDGLGHVISGLTIQRPDQSNVGLFGTAARAAIGNVGLINAQVAGNEQVGTLVGRFFNSTLRNAHASGSVSGNFFVGGLVGFAFSDSTIRAAWSDVATSGGEAAGGIAGGAINAFVSEVLSTGSTSGSAHLGGIVGLVDSSTIADAHASGTVSGTSRLGGLLGGAYNAAIINSYASGRVHGQSDTGGLVGVDASRLIASSYWNTETSGIAASASQGGVGKTTAELQKAATFADWSLDNVGGQDAVWRIYEGYTAPLLKVFLTPAVVDVTGQGSAVYDGTAQLAGVSYALRGGLSAGPVKGGLIGRTDAGTYAIGMDGLYSGQLGYDLIGGTVGSLTITPRPLVITADDITRIYGDGNPALTYAITEGSLVADEALRGALFTSARGDSDVGRYAIGAGTLTAGPNYAVLFRGGTLTITPRALTVTYTADMASRIYGDAGPALGGNVAVGGLLDGDALSGTAVWHSDATDLSGVGRYGVTGSGLSAGGNYVLNTVQAAGNATALTIAKRAITVVADDQFRVYGDANPQLGYSVIHGGLVNGDTLHGALATDANVRSDVGQYVIDAGALSAGENYDLTIGNGVLRIAPRPLTIVYGADAAERIYGDANPLLSGDVTVIGLANGDRLSGTADWTSDAGIRSDVGQFRVTGAGLDAGANYSVTQLQADGNDRALTVNKRVLYVAADDGIRLEGAGIPPLGYTITAAIW